MKGIQMSNWADLRAQYEYSSILMRLRCEWATKLRSVSTIIRECVHTHEATHIEKDHYDGIGELFICMMIDAQ